MMTIEQLRLAYEREQAQTNPPRTAEELPTRYESITPEWLTAVLCANHPGAAVTAVRLDRPDDGNSNRRRIFIECNEAGRAAGLPASVFCKATHGFANRVSAGLSGAIHGEVNFYNHVRRELSIEAPVCFYARVNDALNSLVMLADLGPDTTFCRHTTEITRARAENQMRLLAALHGRYLESAELGGRLKVFPTWRQFFGQLEDMFEQPCDIGFGMAEEVIPARLFARRREIWPATVASVRAHEQLPSTLFHGDVHLRNWYIAPGGAMGLNDWQAACRGHWSRDVAYALATSLSVDDRRRWEGDLLAYYFEHLQQVAGRRLSFEGVFDAYRQQLMTVLAFWTITINPAPGMPDMQPRDATLEFIRRIAVAMDDLDVLSAFG
jgi:hypothetical protein